ncbi:unnamed protein product [Spirodela intermedia]|uniref:non-specific serine/threonine protein kinase n=1 Tax=Spirodela intermedia TaxID=51605 RepID=A0A7I8LJX2_SPIIN|nr:unnamed protein product [Spirodela intermedia]
MSNSAQSPASVSENETSKGSPPPPPNDQEPPTTKPPPPSTPSPSDSASGSASGLPSTSEEGQPPPPNPTPPAPEDAPSSSPPPPPSSLSPPSSPSLSSPPAFKAPPPPEALTNPASPPLPAASGQPASPPPAPQDSLALTPPPVVTTSPPAESLPVSPPPSDAGTPSPPPSSQLSTPVPEKPVDPSTSLTPPEAPLSTSTPTPPSVITPVEPNPLRAPVSKLPDSVPQLAPPSVQAGSSSSDHTSNITSDGFGSGTIVGVTLAGVLVAAIAIFLVTLHRKKRIDGLVKHYRPPASFSVRSGKANQTGSSDRSDTYYPSTGNTTGSYRGYALHSGPAESAGIGNSKLWFTYEEIADMTHGFSRENLLGEGGFGCVYKGWLEDGRVVAVKQLKAGSGQGEREFRAEVEIISRVHHRHLVSLVGYCIADSDRSLVYEFVPNNTLEHHLHGRGLPVMDWGKRLKIAIGSARGLAYLHEDCHPRIIHRDIKSANILLDNFFEAQVADFGLAKLSNDTNTHVSTRVMGTFGYMAPEYASSGKLTDRSDVFSFGVVLLELITGRKPVDPSQPLGDESLVEWARPRLVHALETGGFEELVDPRLEGNYSKGEMFRMVEAAAACVRHSAPKRPRMVQVLRALDNEGDLPDLTNGVKFGQSTVFESRQQSANMQQFRRMAFGSSDYSSDYYGNSGDYDRRSSGQYSGEYNAPAREAHHYPLNPSRPRELE